MPQWCIIHHFLTWILLFTFRLHSFVANVSWSTWMYTMQGLLASKAQSAGWTFCPQWNTFSFIPFVKQKQVRDHSAGEALSPAHQHATFNHLHIIIHLPQAMNYSVLGFCHENSERIACSSSLLFLFLSLLLLSLFPSAQSSSHLHCCHSGRGRMEIGRNYPPPIMCTCSIPWRHLNAKTEAGLMLLCQKKSTQIISKQTMISRISAHKIRKEMNQFHAHLRTKQFCSHRQQK